MTNIITTTATDMRGNYEEPNSKATNGKKLNLSTLVFARIEPVSAEHSEA